jgi:putative transposase
MPWKECHVMDERLRFVARLLEGEKMAPLCAEFGISRKTGYKIFDRYKDCGVQAFSDRSHRAHRQANRLPAPVEARIVRLKREYPGWGAPKIREKLRQQGLELPHCPAISTVHAVLDRHGLVHRRRRRRPGTAGTGLSRPTEPNALWCADYKGEFMLADRRYCYPLTITDFASRYVLTCDALSTTQEKFAFTVFERAFKEFGLPQAIRTDNGLPQKSRKQSFSDLTTQSASNRAIAKRVPPLRNHTLTIVTQGRVSSAPLDTASQSVAFQVEGPSIIYEVACASTAFGEGILPPGLAASGKRR